MTSSAEGGRPHPQGPRIDILCRVIDNFGDAGICWRLARQLAAALDAQVCLWIDHPESVAAWRDTSLAPSVRTFDAQSASELQPRDLFIAALGAQVPPPLAGELARMRTPWVRYEYLSAEPWIDDCHALPSLKPNGATEWFWYPGYTEKSGGLLREPGLMAARRAFASQEAESWSRLHGLASAPGRLRMCLFGYPGSIVDGLLEALARSGLPIDVFANSGLARSIRLPERPGGLMLRTHAFLSQDDFDRLLWSCDLNLVRGEESWVRAQWAGRPFLWQAYVQDEGLHLEKLRAFLRRMLAHEPDARAAAIIERAMLAFNIGGPEVGPAIGEWLAALTAVRSAHQRWCASLAAQADLVTRLRGFLRHQLQFRV